MALTKMRDLLKLLIISKRIFNLAVNIFRWITFNLWYFRRPPWDTRVSPPELLEFIAAHPPGRALD